MPCLQKGQPVAYRMLAQEPAPGICSETRIIYCMWKRVRVDGWKIKGNGNYITHVLRRSTILLIAVQASNYSR